MPRYDYECGTCGRREERVFSMADMPQGLPCPCGQWAGRVIDFVPEVFVKNREYVFDKGKNVRSFAQDFGKSDQKHHEGYRQYFEDIKKRKRELGTSKRKHEIEWIGGMPGEMVDSIGQHEGDKEAVLKDPVTFLKKTGLYDGD